MRDGVLISAQDGYPIEDATEVAVQTVRRFLEQDTSVSSARPSSDGLRTRRAALAKIHQISRVVFVVFSAKDERVYRTVAPAYFPPGKDYKPAEDDEEETEPTA